MDWLNVDEGSSPALHRWMVLARLLMHRHPRTAAPFYTQWLGVEDRLAIGWNRMLPPRGSPEPITFIFVGPGAGVATEERPDVPDEEIHDVHADALPELETTAAWRRFDEASIVLRAEPTPAVPAAEIGAVQASVLAAGRRPLFEPTDRELDARFDATKRTLRADIDAAAASGAADFEVFLRPLRDVIGDVLAFRLDATRGSAMLATLLATFATAFPNPVRPPNRTAAFVESADHLVETASTIAERRDDFDLGGWSRLTYLSYLLARAALYMFERGAPRAAHPDVQRLLRRRAVYVDELIAHDLGPSLLCPLAWVPAGMVELLGARRHDLSEERGVYAPARVSPAQPQPLWPRVAEHSRRAPRAGRDLFLSAESLLAPALRENLQLFLLTMVLGHAAQ
jgi:hypothetical protein